MLTGFTFCIPIKTKSAEEVITAWRNHISFPFGVCRKLLTDNGTEFKNDLFNTVAEQLGVERKIYMPPQRPQSNGCIEGFIISLKQVYLNIFLGTENGMTLHHRLQHPTIGYQTNIQGNHHFSSCLVEMH